MMVLCSASSLFLRAGNGWHEAQASVASTVQHKDRFYHNAPPFPSFSAFRGFLSVCPLYSPVWLSIFLIIAGIIRTFAVSFIPRITTFNGMDMGVKEIKVEIQKLALNDRATLA